MDDDSERPRLNVYGKVIVGCLLAGVVTTLVGGPGFLSGGLFGLAVVVVAVAMRRNARADDGQRSDEDGGCTDDTEMKAKGMVGGEAGSGGL